MGPNLSPEIIDFVAGSVAGAVSVAVGQPFDTVKVRIQTSMEYTGPSDCFRKIVKHEGVSRLFSGMLPPLATSSLINAIIFSSYGYVNKFLATTGMDKSSMSNIYVSGCVAGFAQTFIACPCELVKIKLQAKTEGKQGVRSVVKDIFHSQGLKGFFRGYESTFYRDTPAFGAYFLSYYCMMDVLEKPLGSVMAAFISGGVVQISLSIEFKKPLYLHIRNAYHCFSELLEKETVRGLMSTTNATYDLASLDDDQLSLLQYFKQQHRQHIVVHCFTGSLEELQYYINLGCFIGLTGHVFSLPKETIQDMLQLIPLSRLVIETDAPYMGFKGCREGEDKSKSRKYPNVPSALPKIATFIAEILNISYEELCRQTTKNALCFFETNKE